MTELSHTIYREILKAAASDSSIEAVCQGLTWTCSRIRTGEYSTIGFAQSSGDQTRTLAWPGTLRGKTVNEITPWLNSWNSFEATVALATCNAVINGPHNSLMEEATPLAQLMDNPVAPHNLAIFEYFKPQLANKKVVVIGRYPGLEKVLADIDYVVLERKPGPGDLPDPAAEFVLPQADWVFLTATSLINKTFERLAKLAEKAITVLMGPTTPWLPAFGDHAIDFIAGVKPVDMGTAEQIVAEGGGTRLFEGGVHYALANISASRQRYLKDEIARTAKQRAILKNDMEDWFQHEGNLKFPRRAQLEEVDQYLSSLDSAYKRLWDLNGDL